MKMIAQINGESMPVEIRYLDGKILARVEDREYELEADEIEPGLYHFKLGAAVHEVYVSPSGLIDIGRHQIEVSIVDPRALRGASSAGALADGLIEIKTAMPGKVVRVIAAAGQEIAAGEGVIVVEAMKMQNEMKSPKDGIVREIRFAEGDTVNGGDVLAVIE